MSPSPDLADQSPLQFRLFFKTTNNLVLLSAFEFHQSMVVSPEMSNVGFVWGVVCGVLGFFFVVFVFFWRFILSGILRIQNPLCQLRSSLPTPSSLLTPPPTSTILFLYACLFLPPDPSRVEHIHPNVGKSVFHPTSGHPLGNSAFFFPLNVSPALVFFHPPCVQTPSSNLPPSHPPHVFTKPLPRVGNVLLFSFFFPILRLFCFLEFF